MSDKDPGLSPYLGGTRARLPQFFLLLLHVTLEFALIWLAVVYWRITERLPFETWQKWAFASGLGLCFLAFGWRAQVIARDLLRARRSGRESPDSDDS